MLDSQGIREFDEEHLGFCCLSMRIPHYMVRFRGSPVFGFFFQIDVAESVGTALTLLLPARAAGFWPVSPSRPPLTRT